MKTLIKKVKVFFWLNLISGIITGIAAFITDTNYGFAAILLINAGAFYSIQQLIK